MTVLHVSIACADGKRFKIKSDNLRREDANEAEIAMANILEQTILAVIKTIPGEIVKEDVMQSGPEAAK
jgi:hypothetical protein